MPPIDSEADALRLARSLASDLARFRTDGGADPRAALAAQVAEARAIYHARVAPAWHPRFEDAVDEALRGPGTTTASPGPPPRRAAVAGAAALACVGLAVYLAARPRGAPAATLDLTRDPAAVDLTLAAGDRLTFQVDLAFTTRSASRRDPEGCRLELALTQGGRTASGGCDLFPDVSVGASSSRETLADGTQRRRKDGVRLACALDAPGQGPATLRATTTLDRCVAQVHEATLRVRREAR